MQQADSLRGDRSRWESVETEELPWEASPSGTVWRRRLHRVGPLEAGQVTSVVRFEPGAIFPAHDHPGGEEILVLEGVFEDDRGTWPSGSYLLNPEGFRHRPASAGGCTLFVKLRQYHGVERRQVGVQCDDIAWVDTEWEGVHQRLLYEDAAFPESVCLERWAPGACLPPRCWPAGAEFLTLSGTWEDFRLGAHGTRSWVRIPPGASLEASTSDGCVVYLKANGVADLWAAGGLDEAP